MVPHLSQTLHRRHDFAPKTRAGRPSCLRAWPNDVSFARSQETPVIWPSGSRAGTDSDQRLLRTELAVEAQLQRNPSSRASELLHLQQVLISHKAFAAKQESL